MSKYSGFASIIVEKIIAYQIDIMMSNERLNDINMISDYEYEYKDYIFKCVNVFKPYDPKFLNLQQTFKWFVTKKTHPNISVLFGSIFQHYIGNESDILVLNSDLDSETLNEYHTILQIIYAYVRLTVENTYDSVILDYIKENDYKMISKYELFNQLKLEYDNN